MSYCPALLSSMTIHPVIRGAAGCNVYSHVCSTPALWVWVRLLHTCWQEAFIKDWFIPRHCSVVLSDSTVHPDVCWLKGECRDTDDKQVRVYITSGRLMWQHGTPGQYLSCFIASIWTIQLNLHKLSVRADWLVSPSSWISRLVYGWVFDKLVYIDNHTLLCHHWIWTDKLLMIEQMLFWCAAWEPWARYF